MRKIEFWLEVCVTHWRIYEAAHSEPYAHFGFYLCPIEEGDEHEVVIFQSTDGVFPRPPRTYSGLVDAVSGQSSGSVQGGEDEKEADRG